MDQVTIYLKETQQREKDQVDRTIWGSQEQIIHHQSKTEQEGTDWDGLQPVLPPRSTQKVSRTERNWKTNRQQGPEIFRSRYEEFGEEM